MVDILRPHTTVFSFVAMEYYAVALNRTFVIAVTEHALVGYRARGMISAEGGRDQLTKLLSGLLAVKGDLLDPWSYVDTATYQRSLARASDFEISLSEVRDIRHDPSKKWGMGYYPHDGRLLVEYSGKSREFIVIGGQSGSAICSRIIQARRLG